MRSQPLDPKFNKKLGLSDEHDVPDDSEKAILSQRIGKMFDDIRASKPSFSLRIQWTIRGLRGRRYDIKFAIRNRWKWRKTLNRLRPWEGFDGLLTVMITHLRDYIECEETYGHTTPEYKSQKIASAKETVALLERMREPDEYSSRRRSEVESYYPKYKSLITKYVSGGTCISGDFVPQGNGFVGTESGKDPRSGYFEFVDGRFTLAESPDQAETDRLLAEVKQYHEDIANAYRQAGADSDADFARLAELLKENLYSWWD